jgi:hypothetical protein
VLAQSASLVATAPQVRTKNVRRVKQVAKIRRSKAVDVGGASAAAHAMDAVDAAQDTASSRVVSSRACKQQKVGDGGLTLLQAVLGGGAPKSAGGSWQFSPPLNKVQERHSAFALHAQANVSRGSSFLAESARAAEHQAREVDGLASSVEACALD